MSNSLVEKTTSLLSSLGGNSSSSTDAVSARVILLFLISTTLVVYGIYRVFVYPFYFSPYRHLPEPPAHDAALPWAHAESIRKEHNGAAFRRWIQTVSASADSGLIRFRVLFNQDRLLLASPQAVREVVVTKSDDYIKPSQPTFLFRQMLGNGVLVAEGAEHKRQRKALLPAFSYRHIKDLYPLFWSKARTSTEEIARHSQPQGSGPPVTQKAYDWASRTTLDIIGHAAMGHDFNSLRDPDSEVVQTYRVLFANEPPYFRWTVTGVLLPLEQVFKLPIPSFRIARRAADTIRNLGYRMVKEKRAKLEKGMCEDVDILTVAMKSGQFGDDDLVNQLMTFLAAGHETTSSALTWAIDLLCRRPEIQARLREEVRSSLPPISDPDSVVVADQIDRLKYLNAVCNEVLRVMPSVPITSRDAAVDTTILGQPVLAGTRVFISPWAINAHPDLWGDDANEFKPERWLGDGAANNGGAQTNFANLTFLHGPRSCIGKDFAKAEFACLLAAWIGRFEVSWAGGEILDQDIEGWVTVHPKHRLPVVFKEVPGW